MLSASQLKVYKKCRGLHASGMKYTRHYNCSALCRFSSYIDITFSLHSSAMSSSTTCPKEIHSPL
ncbi:hypothetical protein PUNSTDRAFT_122620 [Punctularia strigosozonata HHB-11173 SS5]|uniref:Uncharacterized protein n=1 Tax=Punctularia strigosozonata (strain HHB-11173) TaxID=741275 RepID=R7S3Y4_PUNST|nr:uncharacterized protein PUNSTDRAFT_122620 [Punctularia strigosozonata HHB-11173 SS5]EIN04923.1 hypothetical protein PUNSTDRAFT_122620 [Punctularia strigosozonata HHB-11173 SS5]